MEISITDFLPKYPDISNNIALDPYNEDFYEVIYKKKEFYDERLPRIEEVPNEAGQQMKHQKLIARFLSSYTPYNSLLLYHEMGTGKTCSSIAAIEQIKNENNGFNGALILARGDNLLDNYMNELIFKCTYGQYIPEDYNILTELEKVHRKKKAIRDWYDLRKFDSMAKEIKRLSDKILRDRYSNKVIVIDEIHNIREHDSDIAMYKQFHRLLHIVENCKIILMSGTPMKDTPDEISTVMNLILPLDKQLPTGDEFLDRYFIDKNSVVLELDENNIDELRDAFRGRVSYLKSMHSDVTKVFEGTSGVGNLHHFIVSEDIMSEFQTLYYTEAYLKDTTTKGIYNNSRQASLFVYPDGTWGVDGFTKYMKKIPVQQFNTGVDGKKTQIYSYSMEKSLLDSLVGKDNNETLNKIAKYSSKYAVVIKNILKSSEDNKSGFVYCEFVTGSGAILFSKILSLFGFTEASGMEKKGNEKPRYGLITNKTATRKKLRSLIDRFNQPDNLYGKVINVIIGSRVIGEGFSLKNVQDINILTPFWNYSETAQAIARGYRLGSHNYLIDAGVIPNVAIHQLVSIPNDNTTSIDLEMYEVSEAKDINIKLVERQIKEMDIFCALTYDRNYIPGYDYQRECQYMNCDYICKGISEYDIDKLDLSTYNLYYSNPNISKITTGVSELFKNFFSIDLQTIIDYFSSYYMFEIISALVNIINENIVIYNKYGLPSYLREENNVYFLVNSLTIKGTFNIKYYTENPNIKHPTTFSKILDELSSDTLPSLITSLCNNKDKKEVEKFLGNLSLKIQELILESSIIALEKEIDSWFRKIVLKYYKSFYSKIDGVWISWLLYRSSNVIKCLGDNGLWRECDQKYLIKLEQYLKESKKELETNQYGYYGIKNPQTGEFCIKDVSEDIKHDDKRKTKRGKRCVNWGRGSLTKIIVTLAKIPPPDNYKSKITIEQIWPKLMENKYITQFYNETNKSELNLVDMRRALYWGSMQVKQLCSTLEKWFRDNNMLVEDHTCGSKPTKQSMSS
jgi:superfamily II DNA or RNA helicase